MSTIVITSCKCGHTSTDETNLSDADYIKMLEAGETDLPISVHLTDCNPGERKGYAFKRFDDGDRDYIMSQVPQIDEQARREINEGHTFVCCFIPKPKRTVYCMTCKTRVDGKNWEVIHDDDESKVEESKCPLCEGVILKFERK